MDFVWTYCAELAPDQGLELRYSIRSVLANHKEACIWLVGSCPSWYKGNYIPLPRIRHAPKCHNFVDGLRKVRHAATQLLLKKWVWMMDDIYFLQPFDSAWIRTPRYHCIWTPGTPLPTRPHPTYWDHMRKETLSLLHSAGYNPVYDFATHAPHYIHSDTLLAALEKYPTDGTNYLWETIYGNFRCSSLVPVPHIAHSSLEPEPIADSLQRVLSPTSLGTLRAMTLDPSVMMINNNGGGWTMDLKRLLHDRYPNPSPCERDA